MNSEGKDEKREGGKGFFLHEEEGSEEQEKSGNKVDADGHDEREGICRDAARLGEDAFREREAEPEGAGDTEEIPRKFLRKRKSSLPEKSEFDELFKQGNRQSDEHEGLFGEE